MHLDDSQALEAHILQNIYLWLRLTSTSVSILRLQGVTDRQTDRNCYHVLSHLDEKLSFAALLF